MHYKSSMMILVTVFFLLACAKNEGGPCPGFLYKDVRGREVCVGHTPQRIVSLAPSTTEIIFALGRGDRLVGDTAQCDYPEAARAIRKVGNFNQPNIELIIACEPDMVLAGNQIPEQAIHALESAGYIVLVSEALSFNNIFQTITDLGKILQAEAEADTVVKNMQAKIQGIIDRVHGARPVSCYYMISFGEQGNWSVGRGSFIHEILELAGGYNIARDLSGPWGIFDLEMLLHADPEVIFVGKTAGDASTLSRLPLYKDLSAVKKGRVITIDDDLLSRPGPRIVLGLEIVARALHPDRFPQDRQEK